MQLSPLAGRTAGTVIWLAAAAVGIALLLAVGWVQEIFYGILYPYLVIPIGLFVLVIAWTQRRT